MQNGKNLTLNASVTSAIPGAKGVKADCITDGADLESSTYFQKSSNAATGAPYMFTIDMKKEAKISEINLSTRLVNGSEAAYKYTIEGSLDGKNYKTLVDGRTNWQLGFLILNIEDPASYSTAHFHTGIKQEDTGSKNDIIEVGKVGEEAAVEIHIGLSSSCQIDNT